MASPFHLRRGFGAASANSGSDYPVHRRGRGEFRHDDSTTNFPLPTRAAGPRRAGNGNQAARLQNRGVPRQQRQQQEPIVAACSIPEHRRRRIWLPIDGPRAPDPENEGASECPSEPRTYPPPTHVEDRPDAFVVMEGGEASHRWMLPRGHVPSAPVSVSREADAEPRRHRIRKGKGKGKARVELCEEDEEEVAAPTGKQQRNSNNAGASSGRPTKRTITPPKQPRSKKPAASQHSNHFAHSPHPDEDEVGSGDASYSWVEVEEGEASSTVTGDDEKKISQALTEDEDDGYHQPPFIERFRSSGASHHEAASGGQGGRRGAPAAAAAAAAAVQSRRRAGGGSSVATNTPATTVATARVEDLISFEEELIESLDGVGAEGGEEEEDLIIFD
ncbi:MAG: hypothetical protein L6R35_001143 [Caloplaca aegaea]|nr:MAG: hypothetical protein L6R35_001143 [Caloplaca aegaea]